jgi:ankyrin repeat protein
MASNCSSEDECTSNILAINGNDCTTDCMSNLIGLSDWSDDIISNNNCMSGEINYINDEINCSNDSLDNHSDTRISDRSVIEVDDYIIDNEHIYDNILKYVFKKNNISALDMILQSITPKEIFTKTGSDMFRSTNYVYDDISCFIYLLKHGLFINERNTEGNTPLHLALLTCNAPAGRFIIKKGGDINSKNQNGDTPVYLYFLTMDEDNRRLMRLIFERDYDFNNKNADGDTPLHVYLRHRLNIQLIESILERNYDVTVINNKHQTTLHTITKYPEHDDILAVYELFLKRGFNIKAKDNENHKCYHHFKKNLRNRIRKLAKLYSCPDIKEPEYE